MGTPSVSVTKNVFTTGTAPPSSVGILAIIAASSTGTANQPGGFARSDLAVNSLGYGPLTDMGAYDLAVAGKPFVAVKCNATFTGSYGTISKNLGTGTTTVVAGATNPFDHYDVQVTIVNGGTIGVAGITYTYSTDGGRTVSGVQALGTASTLTIPNTGVSFTLGAGNLLTGASWEVFTERPLANDSDVTTSLTALGNTRLPFEMVLIDSSATSSTVGLVDAVLASWESRGVFKAAIINSRYKQEPEPATESEAAFATAVGTTFGNSTSVRMCVGADGAHAPSLITGWNLKRPTSMFLAARAMAIPIGEDPAFIARGPLTGAQIADNNGNPFDHDEELFPGLDALRLVSLRSFAPGGPQGVYINNANTIQPTGGSFPYLQFIRIANRAAEVAWFILTTQLSLGVRKNLKADPVTGVVTMFEPDAARIEDLVNDALVQPLKGQVSGYQFQLSRTDDMNATPVQVNSTLSISALAYVKNFLVQLQFVKSLTTTV